MNLFRFLSFRPGNFRLKARCNHENWGYGIPADSYKEAIVAWNKNRHGVEVDPDSVHLSAGVHPALIAALRAFAPPGSKVLMTTPIYSGFYSDLRETLTVTADSLGKLDNGRYSIDWDNLQTQMDIDTNALILCNPPNPTGNVWSRGGPAETGPDVPRAAYRRPRRRDSLRFRYRRK